MALSKREEVDIDCMDPEEWSRIRTIILTGWENGQSANEIAKKISIDHPQAKAAVGVASGTIKGYIKRIYREAGIHGQAAALAAAYRHGWIKCPCVCHNGDAEMSCDVMELHYP
jgi:DNA-binding CsgD family transcriptional regulator